MSIKNKKMIDIQIYNKDKKIFKRQDLDWDTAHFWLEEKRKKGREITQIDIQCFTMEEMPFDDASVKDFDEAHEFIYKVLEKAKNGAYRGVKVS